MRIQVFLRQIAFGLLSLTFTYTTVLAQRVATPQEWTKSCLEEGYKALQKFKKSCGRFPLNSEGLGALITRPKKANCQKYHRMISSIFWDEDKSSAMLDGWKNPVKYSSDGKTFRLDAGQGFFVTSESPSHGKLGFHWENPNPPPNDCQKLPVKGFSEDCQDAD